MSRTVLVCSIALLLAPLALHAQTTLSNIDDTDRLQWQHCTAPDCAGGQGLAVAGVANTSENPPYNFTVDGTSLRFDLDFSGSGCTSGCWSDALFFNDLTSYGVPNADTDAATHISMDMMVGMDPAGINGSQALEFNVFQTFCTSGPCPNGTYKRFTYSYQCDFQGTGLWRVWDGGSLSWQPTNAACVRFSNDNPNGPSFNHFIFNFTRPDLNHVTYTDFWVNNTHVIVNQTWQPNDLGSTQAHEFEASMQLDGDSGGASYSVWVDQWSITFSH